MIKLLILFLLSLTTMQNMNSSLLLAKSNTLNSSDISDIEFELNSTIEELLTNLDLGNVDSTYIDEYKVFGNTTFKEKVLDLLKGNYFDNYDGLFSAILSLLFDGVASILPLLLMILAISILSSILNNVKSDSKYNVSSIINFVCMAVIISILAINFKEVISKTINCLSTMKSQMDTLFPVLLTLMTAIGGTVSVGIYKPVVAMLTTFISSLFESVLLPIFVMIFLFTIIGSLSPNVKLNKFTGFLNSAFKWIVGFVFTIFSAILTMQGISAGKFDGVSIKASKYAIKSYVPIIGGYISEGFDFVMMGSMLIKNAIGVGGLLILILSIISPIIQIVIFKLGLQLISGMVEATNNNEMSSMIHNCSKILTLPIVILLGVAFMYILTIALIMCTVSVI